MRSLKTLLAVGAMAVSVVCAASAANAKTWIVNGTFDDGTALSGTFDINVYGFLDAANLTTTVGTLPGFTYTLANSYFSNGPTYIDFQPGYQNDLHIDFANPLLTSGSPDPIIGGYECGGSFSCYIPSGGTIRYLDVRTSPAFATAVPEPATWAVMLLGLGGIGYALRRSRKFAAAVTA